jgi:Elongation factor Tu GTP binding domain
MSLARMAACKALRLAPRCSAPACVSRTQAVRAFSSVFERNKPHLNIGTIGHVDHGKTTLTAVSQTSSVSKVVFQFVSYGRDETSTVDGLLLKLMFLIVCSSD